MHPFGYCTCSVWTTISLSVYLSVLAASASLQHLTTSFCPEALLFFYCYTVSHRLASMGVRSAATCLGKHTISPTLHWGRHPWAASQRPENVCHYRCFVAVGRQLLRAMASTLLVSLMLREKTAWNILPRRGLCGQRHVPRALFVRPNSATDSIRKGFVSQLKLPMKHGKGKNGASSAE